MHISRRLPQVLMVVLFVVLVLATLYEHRATESQFNWNPKPRIEDRDKTGGDEVLNELLIVYGPVPPNVPILAPAQRAGAPRQEYDARSVLTRPPSLRAPPYALGVPIAT